MVSDSGRSIGFFCSLMGLLVLGGSALKAVSFAYSLEAHGRVTSLSESQSKTKLKDNSKSPELEVQNDPQSYSIEKIDAGLVRFFNPKHELTTHFHQLKPVARVDFGKNKTKLLPYFLFEAHPCDVSQKECEEPKQLFLTRADGRFKTVFVYPGQVRHHRTKGLLFKSRAFIGRCLSQQKPVFIVFQREKLDRRRWLRRSVFVAEIEPNQIREKLMIRNRPKLSSVLNQVKRNRCEEVPGFDRFSNPVKLEANSSSSMSSKI